MGHGKKAAFLQWVTKNIFASGNTLYGYNPTIDFQMQFADKVIKEGSLFYSEDSDRGDELIHPSYLKYYKLKIKYDAENPCSAQDLNGKRSEYKQIEASLGVRKSPLTSVSSTSLSEVKAENKSLNESTKQLPTLPQVKK